MPIIEIRLSPTFKRFLLSEQASGVLLLVCTVVSLILANSPLGHAYLHAWHVKVAGLPVEVWVNDGLMAVFLFIGLELKRELYVGELSNLRHALLPIVAALGGIVVPAAIHFTLNNGTVTQPGIGIPMATDIAFALGVLALLGNRVPGSLKVFLAALAVIDDLGAIVVIALFYSGALAWSYLGATLAILVVLLMFNRWGIRALWPYLLGGIAMWFCMFQSGVHATIAGVLLAFAIPFTEKARMRLRLPIGSNAGCNGRLPLASCRCLRWPIRALSSSRGCLRLSPAPTGSGFSWGCSLASRLASFWPASRPCCWASAGCHWI